MKYKLFLPVWTLFITYSHISRGFIRRLPAVMPRYIRACIVNLANVSRVREDEKVVGFCVFAGWKIYIFYSGSFRFGKCQFWNFWTVDFYVIWKSYVEAVSGRSPLQEGWLSLTLVFSSLGILLKTKKNSQVDTIKISEKDFFSNI